MLGVAPDGGHRTRAGVTPGAEAPFPSYLENDSTTHDGIDRMRIEKALVAAAVTGGLVLAPIAAATAAPTKPAPRFVVSKLGIVGHTTTYDVTAAAATIKVQVQVKDFDKKFDPTTVKLVVVEKVSGAPATTFTVAARRVGKSKVVSSWQAAVTVPQGSVAATYCLKVVKVDDASPATLPVLALAKGLLGRDCFTVVNTAPAPPPAV